MSEQSNIAVMRRYIEAIDQGNFSIVDQLVSPQFSSRHPDIIPSSRSKLKRTEAETTSLVIHKSWKVDYACRGDLVTVREESVFRVSRSLGCLQPFYWYSGSSYATWRVINGQIVEYVDQGVIQGPTIVGTV